jgi:hypothetical protein
VQGECPRLRAPADLAKQVLVARGKSARRHLSERELFVRLTERGICQAEAVEVLGIVSAHD